MTRILSQQSTENMQYVRRLLSQKQPGFSAALELALVLAELESWPLQMPRETSARLMAGNPAPLVAAQDAARGVVGHLAFPAEAQLVGADDVRMGHGWPGRLRPRLCHRGRQRVMVAAFTRQHFADLAKTTRLAGTFAFLERVLYADFSACADLFAHRGAIAVLLAPWFSRRTGADLAASFAGTSVSWACLHNLTGQPVSRR